MSSSKPENRKPSSETNLGVSIADLEKQLSELRQTIEQLRLSESQIKSYLDGQTEFFVRWKPDGTRLYVNDAYCRYFGITKDQAIGTSFLPLIAEADREDIRQRTEKLSPLDPIVQGEHRVVQADGSEGWNWWTDRGFFDEKGVLVELQSVGKDITERKKTEQALQNSETMYRNLFESADDSIFLLDGGIFTACNPATLKMFRCADSKEIVGKTPVDFSPEVQPGNKKSRALAAKYIAAALEGTPQKFDWLHIRTDGTPFHANVSLNMIGLQGKKLLQAIVRDITQRVETELEIETRLTVETMLAEMASSFVRTTAEDFEDTIRVWLARIAKMLEAERVVVWVEGTPDEQFVPLHIWTTPGIPPVNIGTGADFPWIVSQLRKNKLILSSDVRNLEERGRNEVDLAREKLDVKSLLVVPMLIHDKLWGCVSATTITNVRKWPESAESWMRVVAEIISNALHRHAAERELNSALSEIKQLKERVEAENVCLREELHSTQGHAGIIGKSKVIKEIVGQAEQVAKTDSNVLILGETGTGKELLARAIHDLSERRNHAMITVNCAAMPSTLVEGELFGREKGAYTGALTKQIGRFEAAHKGTIFLDEIGELPLDTQAKLLRVLESGQFERLGSNDSVSVDVRVIAATNRDIEKEVTEGNFREDLFYRLNVFPITVPPLRNHSEDIAELVWSFVTEFGTRMGKRVESINKDSMQSLKKYSWPGNVRELRNLVERSMILSTGRTLQITLPTDFKQIVKKGQSLVDAERDFILDALEKSGWRIRGEHGAAKILGMKPTTLESRIKKHGILHIRRYQQ